MRTGLITLLVTAGAALGGCAVFGDDGPKQHTVIDYESVAPETGDSGIGDYRYGHSGVEHSGTGVQTEDQEPEEDTP